MIRRAIRVGLVASAFGWFWGGAALLAWTVLPAVALFVRHPVERTRACQRIVAWTFRVFHGYMRILNLVRAVVPPEVPRPHGGPVVLVANHPTLVDVTAILSRFQNVCCLAKGSFVKSPFVGRLLSLCGFISAGDDTQTRAAALALAVERLEQGFDILVFPEGTRSPPGGLWPFHRGAFEIACRARVPVVPLLLTCVPSALTKGVPFWRFPDQIAVLTVEPRPAVDPADTNHRSGELRKRVEMSYKRILGFVGGET